MVSVYLYLNAALYALFAVWCSVKAQGTANSLGYALPRPEGLSEYLTVYGGLQLGLALFFFWTAYAGQERAGVMFSLFLYGGIVVFRGASLLVLRPAGGMIYAIAGLEFLLLAGAVAVWWLRMR